MLAATISTPLAAPVIAGTQLRGGSAASSRGAASFATASVTTPMNLSVKTAIAGIPEAAWAPVKYPRAIWDDQLRCWISDD